MSRNPANKQLLRHYDEHSSGELESSLADLHSNVSLNSQLGLADRCEFLKRFAELLRQQRLSLAELISLEMGKLLTESLAEVDKSIELCEQFVEQGPEWLADSEQHGARIQLQPVGVVLAVMPWNFPIWQVLRCAIPAWLAGNTLALKHATNVSGCALKLEALVNEAAGQQGYLRVLLVGVDQVADVIDDARVRALHFTGSITVGRRLAAQAAAVGKRSVLELGGSDPFIVLPSANIEQAAAAAVVGRFRNAGQSCTAAKRLIVTSAVYDEFVDAFVAKMQALQTGDPLFAKTTLAPLARQDFLLRIQQQTEQALAEGASVLATGAEVSDRGWFAAPVLMAVERNSVLTNSETFGPIAAIQRAETESEAVLLANDSRYGLGASVWGGDSAEFLANAGKLADHLQCGVVAINQLTRSSPMLPFGGVKDSGYGYELGRLGLMEMVTAKVVLNTQA